MTRKKPEEKQTDWIVIKGAREHNLQNVEVRIPKNKLVVFSGISGSGKSTLAMDTLYAEGQRRYVESLSSYARQFLEIMKRPDVDTIEGLSPAIAIDQHGLSHNPRSTVGTVTEIYDYFRVLFARIGHPHCPQCGREITRQSTQSITKQITKNIKANLDKNGSAKFMILSPIVRDKRGEFTQLFQNLDKKGFEKVRVDGLFIKLSSSPTLIKTNRHNIDVVVDQFVVSPKTVRSKDWQERIQDDVEIATENSDGLVIIAEILDPGFDIPSLPKKTKDHLFSQRFACPVCNLSLPEIEPRIFSFNSPQGACQSCDGLGVKLKIDSARVPSTSRAKSLERQYQNTTSPVIRQEIEKLMIKRVCPSCQGSRLSPESLSVTINKKSIAQITTMSLGKLHQWTKKLLKTKSSKEYQIAKPLLKEINSRLSFLLAVGVDYLSLDRTASTLSVGEAQRIRLSSQIGTGLTGIVYILDEPTVGLHQRDTRKLIMTLKKLRDLGNTVVVVEHDEEVLGIADWIIDFGPGAGKEGGKIVAQGTPQQVINNPQSITGQYLSGKKKIKIQQKKTNQQKIFQQTIKLTGCQEHNLKKIEVEFPLQKLVCVTGVSGSGKSTLIHDTLYPAIKKSLNPYFGSKLGKYQSIKGVDWIDRVLLVDQSPVGRTSRSNPSTYIGVFTDIRQLFAQTREAKLKGLGQGYFSFNTAGGRCEECRGQGQTKIEMQFLPDIWVECEECRGQRFKQKVLEVEYKDKNISQILDLTIGEALEFFSSFPKISKKLAVMQNIGLDYLTLGQLSPTLSGGESQRLKLARELVKDSQKKTVYLLDEPTTGLHFADIKRILKIMQKLIEKQNTIIVIEHNLDVIKNADWIIDLGPEGGERGGEIVAQGTPAQVTKNPYSWTGKYLKKVN